MAKKAAGKGYKSRLDLGLAQLPEAPVSDPLFVQLIPMYNAFHVLNAAYDSVTDAMYGEREDVGYVEMMPFTRAVWVTAAEDLEVGNIVAFTEAGAVKGADKTMTGMTLVGGKEGERVKIGFGPATMEIPDAKVGKYFWATTSKDLAGNFLPEGYKKSVRVAKCFTPGFIIFAPCWFANESGG